MPSQKPRTNNRIRVPEIRLIDESGAQLGVIKTEEALKMAVSKSLDLVEVAPLARPPVCKILDYGKYVFDANKRMRGLKKNSKSSKLKEVRMQPKISIHDLTFKTKAVQSFLSEGNKVKVSIRFRGREFIHPELGTQVLKKVLEILSIPVKIEKEPSMEGRMMTMLLSPEKKATRITENAENKD